MQEANLKNLQLDLIVNRHIMELQKFTKEHEEKLIDFRNQWKENFYKIIESAFQNFIENIDPNLIIYNSENKLIQIKINKGSGGQSLILNSIETSSETKSVKSTKSSDKLEKKISSTNIDIGLFFDYKLNFGLFNRNKLHFYFFKVNDHIENDIKRTFMSYVYSTHSHNKMSLPSETEEYTINDILKTSENFGDNVFAMINFFLFNNSENKVVHLFENLNSPISKIQTEYFFDTFAKFFFKIENQCKKGNMPFEFDIFTTKHTSMNSFDVLLSIFIKNEINGENDLNTGKIRFIKFF
jgi:hypothetical protein